MLRLFLFLITLTLICGATTNIFNLKIFSQNEKKMSGVLVHKETSTGFTRNIKIFDESYNLIGESIEEFNKNSSPISVKKTNYLCPSQNQSIYFSNDNAKIIINNETINVSVPKNIAFGTGFFDKARSSLEQAMKGNESQIFILVPEKEDWFTLTPTRVENISYNDSKAILLGIAPKSIIIRIFVKEIIFIFDTSDKHKPLEFIGVLPFLNADCKPIVGKIYFSEATQ